MLADVPGLIEGASHGAGLGLEFLRHLERTRTLIHVVDASAGVDAARDALATVRAEVEAYSPELAARPSVIAFNKIDLPAGSQAADELMLEFPGSFSISAQRGDGCQRAPAGSRRAGGARDSRRPGAAAPPGLHRIYRPRPRRVVTNDVVREGDGFRVVGELVERMVGRIDLDNEEAVARLQRKLAAAGVDAALAAAGCREGDTVRIGDAEFTLQRGRALLMPVLVFGGTFDPVHNGHLAIARQARIATGSGAVWFVPAALAPLRDPPRATPEERLELLEAACDELDEPGMSVLDLAIRRGGVSYTADVMDALRAEFPATGSRRAGRRRRGANHRSVASCRRSSRAGSDS